MERTSVMAVTFSSAWTLYDPRMSTTGAALTLALVEIHLEYARRSNGVEPRLVRLPCVDEERMREHPDDRLLGVNGSALTHASRDDWRRFLSELLARRYGIRVEFDALELVVE